MRPRELTHLLIEEVDLDSGWIHIRNKAELGWRIKTGAERSIPIPSELVAVLRRVMDGRTRGPLFIRHQFLPDESSLGNVGLNRLCQTVQARTNNAQLDSEEILTREQLAKIQRGIWRDAGAIRRDIIRINLMRISRNVGMPHVTCPKSWSHTFATLLQDANVDPLIRQIVLGHSPSTFGECGLDDG